MITATASAVWQSFFWSGICYTGDGRDTKGVSLSVDINGDVVSLVAVLTDDPNSATLVSFTLDAANAAALITALQGG